MFLDSNEGLKSGPASTSSLNSISGPNSFKPETAASTSSSTQNDALPSPSIESKSLPFSLPPPLPAFVLPPCVYEYPLAPPLLPFINGMTETELRITQKLSLEIRKYNSTFLGRVSEPNAWKEYVKYNRATNDDEFYPNVRLTFVSAYTLLVLIFNCITY